MERACSLTVDDRIFHKTAIFKAAYLYTNEYYIHLSYAGVHQIKVLLQPKPGTDMTDVDKRFSNELLAQMLRYQVSQETRGMRELIIGRALYSTYIDSESSIFEDPVGDAGGYSLDDIAVDWFEVHQDETDATF